MTKQDPFVRRVIIVPVVHRLRRHGPRVVERQDLGRDERGVVAIRDRDHAKRADDDGQRVHAVQFGFNIKIRRRRSLFPAQGWFNPAT
jgi:hypothetical protein